MGSECENRGADTMTNPLGKKERRRNRKADTRAGRRNAPRARGVSMTPVAIVNPTLLTISRYCWAIMPKTVESPAVPFVLGLIFC